MSSLSRGNGVPDFGVMVPRPRVLNALRAFGCRPVLLFGPSGSGKSVAASQYCAGLCKQTVWIDAQGAFFPAERIVSRVSSRLDGAGSGSLNDPAESMSFADLMDRASQTLELMDSPDGLVVVLDDVHGPCSRQASLEIVGLARTLLTHNSQLLITTRDLSAWRDTDLCEFGLIGGDDLALDVGEARDLLLMAGYRSLAPDVEQLRSLSAGHPALFVVLSSQASRHGLDSDVSRVASLDAWIERLLRADLSQDDVQVLLRADLLLTGRAN